MPKGKKSAQTPESAERARRLRILLAQHRMLPTDLARLLNVSDPTVHGYVTGYGTPRPHRLVEIAEKLDESVDWLLGRDKMGSFLSGKLARLAEILGPDRIDYLNALSEEELRELVDEHELERARRLRRGKRDDSKG